jgi:hypothetical protein
MPQPVQIKVLGLNPSLFVLLMIFLGGVLGGAVYLLFAITVPDYLYIPRGKWELALAPPFMSVKLLDYQRGHLYLKSSDGKLHSCDPTSKTCSAVRYVPEPPVRFCGKPASLRPFAPARIISSVRNRECHPKIYLDTHFVLIEDGSVWKWERRWSENDVHSMLLTWIIFGAVVVGIGSSIALWRRSPRLGLANA